MTKTYYSAKLYCSYLQKLTAKQKRPSRSLYLFTRLRSFQLWKGENRLIRAIITQQCALFTYFMLKNIESQVPVVVRSSSTFQFKALKTLYLFANWKSMLTFWGEMCKLSKTFSLPSRVRLRSYKIIYTKQKDTHSFVQLEAVLITLLSSFFWNR